MIDLAKLFECSMGAAVDFAKTKEKGVGIAFRESKGIYSAIVSTSYYTAEIANIPQPKAAFYSFFHNAYTNEYEFPVSMDRLTAYVASVDAEPGGFAMTKNSNINQYLGLANEYLGDKAAGRFVIHPPAPLQKGEIKMQFRDVAGVKMFEREYLPKPIVAIDREDAPIKPDHLGNGFYRGVLVGDAGSVFHAIVAGVEGALIMDLLVPNGVYDAEKPPMPNPAHAFAFADFSLKTPDGGYDYSDFFDVHVDAFSLFTVVKLFRMLPNNADVIMQFYKNKEHPIHISGTDGETIITVKLNVLRTEGRRFEYR